LTLRRTAGTHNGLGYSLQIAFLHYFVIKNDMVMQRKFMRNERFRDTENKRAPGLDDIKVT
jgi:hypothetical protein